MKKRTRIALIVSTIILTMTLLPISVGAVTTPVCESTLNFCGLGTGIAEYDVTANVVVNQTTMTFPVDVFAWDNSLGGIDFGDAFSFEINGGRRVTITASIKIEGLNEYLPILPNYNETNGYYAGSVLQLTGEFTNGGYFSEYLPLVSILLHDADGTESDLSETRPLYSNYIDLERVTFATFTFTKTFTFTTENSYPLSINHTALQWTTIYQDIEIEYPELWDGKILHYYVPYYEAWFNSTGNGDGTYEEGYYTGYEVGYNQGFDIGNDHGYEIGYDDGLYDGQNSIPEEVIEANWTSFIYNAANGFLRFELLPGLPLWGLLMAVVAIPLLIAFLKMFMGG